MSVLYAQYLAVILVISQFVQALSLDESNNEDHAYHFLIRFTPILNIIVTEYRTFPQYNFFIRSRNHKNAQDFFFVCWKSKPLFNSITSNYS